MNSSNMVKVIVAFVAGIVVAVGSTLVYVKAHQPPAQQALVQTAPPPSDPANLPDADHGASSAPPPDAQPVQPAAEAQEEQQPAPVPKTTVKHPVKPKPRPTSALNAGVGHKYRHNDQPDQAPVLLAQNAPPPQPSANPPANPYTDTPQPAPAATPAPAPQAVAPAPQAVAPAPPPVRQPRTVTIPAGTAISIRLGEKLSTNSNYTGDAFRGTLESPIIMNGALIAERGSKVLGKVVNSDKAGRVKGVSDLQLALTEIHTTDGQRVEVQTAALDNQGKSGTKKDAAKVGGGAALGAIIGAIAGGGKGAGIGAGVGGAAGAGDVLLTRGKAVTLETETKLTFQLSAPVTITEHLNN